MGSMFRSEEMALCQLFIQPETAYYSISELGECGIVQFKDMNPEKSAFKRKFVNEVRMCSEMERKLRFIESELIKDGITVPETDKIPPAPIPREIIDIQASVDKIENELSVLSENAIDMKSKYLELTELRHVLENTQIFFTEHADETLANVLSPGECMASERLEFIGGMIPRERVPAFERMLWRISRGNVFLKRAELDTLFEDPKTGNELLKTVVVVFFRGEQLKTRVKKVCQGFHVNLYNCPNSHKERDEMLTKVYTQLQDLNLVLNQTTEHRLRVQVENAKDVKKTMVIVRKTMAIYHTLSLFNSDITKKCLIGEGWIPVSDMGRVQEILTGVSVRCGSLLPSFLNRITTTEEPPTFNRTNKFTNGFQNLIDAYGVASYREANPALYTIVTFPFLFSIMFGDCGHGLIMFAFAAYMCIYEKKLAAKRSKNEIWNIFFAGRYIILLMGLFSIYTGLIYNDVFSVSVNMLGSSWVPSYNTCTILSNKNLQLSPLNDYTQTPYPLGIDPVWQLASNKIIFLNSYKMKLSIIFGVVHMIFGVCMSVVNFTFFKKRSLILVEFLPQLTFLVLLFFYMVAMIFIKWIIYTENSEDGTLHPACAPSVLILFINMMLMTETKPPGTDGKCKAYMFDAQKKMQFYFVIIAVLCIPVMLFGRPLVELMSRKKRRNAEEDQGVQLTEQNQGVQVTDEDQGVQVPTPETFSELMIHQAIHTIEYVLSTISHTASYLRLWALSLAHAQLSHVLWNMVLGMGLSGTQYVGGVVLFFSFAIWAMGTLAILVMMEGLSAFLHTLRLHWVEFMSKFYAGLGYPFQPFCFKKILESDEPLDE